METIQSAIRGVGRNWGWMLIYGIVLIVFGIFALMHPLATGLAVGIMLGISFLFGGVGSLFAAFNDAGWQAKTVDILFGAMSLFAAFVCIANPFSGAVSIVWLIGILFLVMGGFEFVTGFKTDGERIWLILLGVVDMLIGFWAAFLMPPGAALLSLAALVGIAFIFRGAVATMLAFKVRGLTKV